MFEQIQSEEVLKTPKTHELRIAVFSLSQRALIGSFSNPSLFIDTQEVREDGMLGISHEARAINIRNRVLINHDMPPVKAIGRLSSIEVEDLDAEPNKEGKRPTRIIDGYAVNTTSPYNFRNFRLRRYDLAALEPLVDAEIENPGTTLIDPVDAKFLVDALQSVQNIKHRTLVL